MVAIARLGVSAIAQPTSRTRTGQVPQAPISRSRSVSVRQPVAVNTYKTRDTPTTTSRIDSSDEYTEKIQNFARNVQQKWDETEEKPAVVAITVAAFVAVWAASGVIDAVDRLPVIGGLLEFVGLIVTGWATYRYLIFGPDRQELKQNIGKFYEKISGKSS